MIVPDYMGVGGVHGARNAYIHRDLRTNNMFCVPTQALSDIETLKALNHIYGDHPRRGYYSDNAKPLMNAATLAGLVPSSSLQGVSQTNGLIEVTNRIVLNGIRKLLCNAGLPACWWPYAGPLSLIHI